jgi:hypothetical protein
VAQEFLCRPTQLTSGTRRTPVPLRAWLRPSRGGAVRHRFRASRRRRPVDAPAPGPIQRGGDGRCRAGGAGAGERTTASAAVCCGPIRESNGDTIGFGARRLFDDDRIEAKYLNTPETAIYKKSNVLYGLDLARRDIARASQAVVVEGYTDVMACHLSGVPTAVATCGTAFGDDHGPDPASLPDGPRGSSAVR